MITEEKKEIPILQVLSQKELEELIRATHEGDGLLAADGSPILNPRERCNEIWKRICRERSLDFSSITPTDPPNPKVFLARRITN